MTFCLLYSGTIDKGKRRHDIIPSVRSIVLKKLFT